MRGQYWVKKVNPSVEVESTLFVPHILSPTISAVSYHGQLPYTLSTVHLKCQPYLHFAAQEFFAKS